MKKVLHQMEVCKRNVQSDKYVRRKEDAKKITSLPYISHSTCASFESSTLIQPKISLQYDNTINKSK